MLRSPALAAGLLAFWGGVVGLAHKVCKMHTMASVVSNRRGGWEIRESHSTPSGPRSRTLASFRTLDEAVLKHAERRAKKPFDRAAVTRSARRAGAQVATSTVEQAARDLVTSLARGAELSPGLAGALAGQLERLDPPKLSAEALQASEWAGATMRERGRVLFDLLEFADALPNKRAGKPLRFPRMIAA
ncbi:MAG: hypothetical protein QM648_12300 [Solirubrobacterales bacterium]